MMLDELVKVIPSFLKRVDVPERGVAWTDVHGRAPRSATAGLVASMCADDAPRTSRASRSAWSPSTH